MALSPWLITFLRVLLIMPVVAAFTPTPLPTASHPFASASPSSISAFSVLLSIKASIDPTGYVLSSSWNVSSSYCDWLGIFCDDLQDVIGISLSFRRLNGTLPSQIKNLQNLTTLDLSENQLSGELPSSLGRLRRLGILDLSGNQLSGELPPSLGQMKSLQVLDLSENQLSGELPSSIGQMKSLQVLDLSGNQLSGELPSTLGQIKSLLTLHLSVNQFSGPLPSSLEQMESLQTLNLLGNQLYGELPSTLERMKSLQNLLLSQNQLSGELPSFLGQKKSLFTLDLSANRFFGPLPSSLGQMESLQTLILSGNHLSGELPSSLGRMKFLDTLDLSKNQLSGKLPSFLGQMESLQTLILSQNQFSGELPSSLGQMEFLQTLNLSGNQLSGKLSSTFEKKYNLTTLDLSKNQFSGPLPSSFGQIESFVTLDLSGNQLSGELPSTLGQMFSLITLDLSANQFSGPLPSSLGQILSLPHLDMSRNQLSGPFPAFILQIVGLQFLDLSYNQLSGSLPSSLDFSSLSLLQYFNVSYNQLQGSIPLEAYQKFSSTSFLGYPKLRAPDQARRSSDLVVVVLCAIGLASFLVCLARYRFRKKEQLGFVDFVAPQYKAWTVEEMRVATNNFDANNIIGCGSTSVCYLGTTESPQGMTRLVALKRVDYDYNEDEDDNDEARKSFVNECKTLSQLRHRNLVKVVGYCVEGRENFALVMEYMEGGDLDRRLHMQHDEFVKGPSMARRLSWEERVNVALDIAEGLVYLHHEYEKPIIHCDIKPQNILLGADNVAKISDFGTARLMQGKQRGDMSMSKFRGSFGYIAPEYGLGLRISTKVDVYSYGMLLLELITGVKPTSLMLANKVMNLPTWCRTLQASDRIKDILQDYDIAILEEAKKLLTLGVQCSHDVANERPTMYIVRDFILQLKKMRVQNDLEIYNQLNN